MPLALHCHHAVDVFAGRLEDGHIHYGLVFFLPGYDAADEAARASIQKFSDLDTRSRHGYIENWWVGVPVSTLPPGHVALLIPRTWLIRQGFLPWWVALLPFRAFRMRRATALQRHIWLECPNSAGTAQESPSAQAA